jgi:enamine deaminase RidA (YjgF/YER057c/UK114 family)
MMGSKSLQIIQRRDYREIHFQIIPLPDETPRKFSERIGQTVSQYDSKIIRATFFGKLTEEESLMNSIGEILPLDFPYTWIEGDNCTASFINGVYVFSLSGLDITRLSEKGRVIGSFFSTKEAEFCFLGGLYSNPDLSASQQTSELLKSAENILNQVDLSFQNTVRTWFYLDEILDWYDEFNLSRTSFFSKHDVFNKLVPASTGISGKNNYRAKVSLELTAIKSKNKNFSIEKVISPLQCPAENYGSSFSRAAKYSDNEFVNLTVSGTASINKAGESMYKDDLRKQIDLSFRVVTAILESQDFKLSDIIRFYVYFNDKSFIKVFNDYINNNVHLNFAYICSENRICRDGLLFEIELDAIRKLT